MRTFPDNDQYKHLYVTITEALKKEDADQSRHHQHIIMPPPSPLEKDLLEALLDEELE